MRHWCIVTSPENWEICKKHGLWGMDFRYFVTLEKYLQAGDRAAVYIHGGNFVALVEFKGRYFFDEQHIGWKKAGEPCLFPYRIKFDVIQEARTPIKISFSTEQNDEKAIWESTNFIDDIVFIADRSKTWNQYVQVSILRITEEDFSILEKAITTS